MPTVIPTGNWVASSATALRTSRMTSSELLVGSTQMPMNVAVWPLKRTSDS